MGFLGFRYQQVKKRQQEPFPSQLGVEIPQELMELCRYGGRIPEKMMGGEGSHVWEPRNILLGNFRISCSHKRVVVVWALAGAQWDVGAEKPLRREFRGGIQGTGRVGSVGN